MTVPVLLTSTLYGEQPAVATSITADALTVETSLPCPVGAAVLVVLPGPSPWEWWTRVERTAGSDVRRTLELRAVRA